MGIAGGDRNAILEGFEMNSPSALRTKRHSARGTFDSHFGSVDSMTEKSLEEILPELMARDTQFTVSPKHYPHIDTFALGTPRSK